MRITEVIPSRRWRNKITGQTASIYGSCPWTSDLEAGNWSIEECGWTWSCSNGTIGIGRQPAKTKEEAIAFMTAFNERML